MKNRFIVCFYKRKRNTLLRRILHPDFGSVGVIKLYELGDSIGVNMHPAGIDLVKISDISDDRIKKYCSHALIVEADITHQSDRLRFWTTPIRCAAIAKLVLRIHNPFIITPRQLYKNLLSSNNKNAKLIKRIV